MKKIATRLMIIGLMLLAGIGYAHSAVYAEDNEGEAAASQNEATTKLTITPVSKTLQLSPNSTYDGILTVTNDGEEEMRISVYASPYFYSYSEEEDTYKLGFNTENNYTQLARWITIKDSNGSYVANPTFTIPAKGEDGEAKSLNVEYRVTVPSSIPAGGQYAALFVQTMTGRVNQNGIHTETSAGMTIYGHSTEGESIIKAEINGMTIGLEERAIDSTTKKNCIYGHAKVKNGGNTDFYARGTLKVEPIIGFSSYETDGTGVTSVIPDAELPVEDKWVETPDFGIFKVTWTVIAGEEEQTIEQVIYIINPVFVILCIIVLTIAIVLIIIGVRRSKERKSRLAV